MKRMLLIAGIVLLGAFIGSAADPKAGKAVYDKSCKNCHGPDGAPVESVAKMFKVEMKDLRSGDVQALSEADVAKIVSGGKGKMVAQKAVTGAAVNDVAAYVKTLKK